MEEKEGREERERGKSLILCLSIPPSLPSSFSHPLFLLPASHFLPASFFFPSSPALFSSLTYLICIHLLPDRMCHRTTNYLICLLPLLLPFSIPLLHYLPSSPHAEFPHFLSPPLRQPRYLSLSPPLSLSLPCWPPPFLNLTLSFLVPSALSG